MFRAYEPDRDRLVAVKVFRLDLPPDRAHRLVAEFERLIDGGVRHPWIAAPVATGIDGVVPYLAQEFVAGDSLDIVIRENGSMRLSEALRIGRQIAEGLDYAAELEFEHGAIHPRDVLHSPDGTRIVGIGVTRALERIGAAVPIRRPYTAPERVENGAWDRRADIFSLAAVIHEMLWGRRVVGTGMQAVESMTPLEGTHLIALQAVFARALAEQPVDRFATATEFIESLESATSTDAASDPADVVDVIVRQEPPVRAPRDGFRVVDAKPAPPSPEPMLQFDEDIEPPPPDPEPVIVLHRETAPEHELHLELAPPPEPEVPRWSADPVAPVERLEPPARREPLERLEPREPLEPLAPLEPLEPRTLRDPLMSVRSGPPMEARDARVWPIGLACVIGLAVGFGAGYVVASRDRASVAPVVAADVRLPSEPTTTSRPPQAAVAPKPTVIPPAKADQVVYPFSGTVAVRSAPAGARVVVDGRDRGATPITVNDLARGDHIVRIMRDGYTAAERRIVLTPNRPLMQLSVPLAKTPGQPAKAVVAPKQIAVPTAKAEAKTDDTGTVLIESRPTGATVYMDNRAVGRTPLALSDVKTGDHAVRLELNGHRSWSASIKVAGGQNRVGGSLEKID